MSLEDPDPDSDAVDGADDASGTDRPDRDREELEAWLDLLTEENRRLRREYARIRTTQYRKTAFGLAGLGAIAVLAGVVFPGSRTVMFVLGATGLFGGLLTYYLTPERFIPAGIGERVYAGLADTLSDLVSELGLSGTRVYVPLNDEVRLFVPQREPFDLPDAEALADTLVVGERDRTRGLATTPTGARLFEEFDAARTGPLSEDPGALAGQLSDAVVEGFELARSVRTEVDAESGRVTFAVSGDAYGAPERFDHPVASFFAVGMARGLETPVTCVVSEGDDRADYLVTVERYGADSSERAMP